MDDWRKIDKDRLTVFTDAIMAIIMTILVLDLKVPVLKIETNQDLQLHLVNQLPHFLGFAISFSMIVIIWFSHQHLMKILSYADVNFTILNFLFSGSIATLPFSTALVSEYPSLSSAVAILALNMLLMNLFLTGMYIYIDKRNLRLPDATPLRYKNIKQRMGVAGIVLLFLAVIFASFSTRTSLLLIIAVPLMHCVPVRSKTN